MIDFNLLDFAIECGRCTKCGLAGARQNVVVYRGSTEMRVMLVGEAPGADEDASGKPFVGVSGQLLDKMFASVGIDTNDLFVTNTVKCRPPNNRPPDEHELWACKPWLDQQIALVKPRFIIAVGNSALTWFSGSAGITKRRGKWFYYKNIPVMPIYHPSYLLRSQHKREEPDSPHRQTYADLQTLTLAYASGIYKDAEM